MSSPQINFGSYGNAVRPPVHRMEAEPTPINPDMFPYIPIDIEQNRGDIVQGAELPEVVPVLTGLRQNILERRIAGLQAKAEELDHRHDVLENAGKSIIQGKGYSKESVELRPVSFSERVGANRLERTAHRRRLRQTHANHLHNTLIDPVKQPMNRLGDDFRNPVERTEIVRSRADRKSIASNHRQFTRATKASELRDTHFTRIISSPANRAQRVLEKRDKLIRRSVALRVEELNARVN